MKKKYRYISLFFALMILINAFSLAIIQVHYQLNQDYIAKNFCENKDKPTMGCHGHCHFTKQIQKAADKTKDGSSAPKIRLELNFVNDVISNNCNRNFYIMEVRYTAVDDQPFTDFYPSIDKPPC